MISESRAKNPALLGIGFMCLGMMMFSLNDAMGKWLLGSYGVGQLLLIRSLAALVVLGPAMWREGRALLMPQKPWLNLFRIALSTLEVSFFYWAVSYLPLAETTTFWLAVPIYVALLAVPLLGEHIPARRWVAIAIGFCGVLLAVQPGGALFGWPSLIALVGSMAFAAMMIVTRKLRGTPDITLVAWQTFAALVGGAARGSDRQPACGGGGPDAGAVQVAGRAGSQAGRFWHRIARRSGSDVGPHRGNA